MSSFSKEMRIATRQPHALSDALANSKLVLGLFFFCMYVLISLRHLFHFIFHIVILFTALSDETVWADALVVFYDIFKCLEDIKKTIKLPQLELLFVDDRLLRYILHFT